MNLGEQQIKLLARIGNDSPVRGDGQEFVKLLRILEIDALEQSVMPDDVRSRWGQGQAMALKNLQKQFADAKKP